jgi:integrase
VITQHYQEAFLRDFDLSHDRRAAVENLLADLERWLAPRSLDDARADDVVAFMEAKLDAGFHPNTVRKWLLMSRTFYGWMYEQGAISAETLLTMRTIPAPAGSSSTPRPRPYSQPELRAVRAVIDQRWPRLGDREAQRYAEWWRAGRSPYSQVRRHAIRLQLEAIIALAAELGLRRSEIWRLCCFRG